jgi:hypothetical protein
VTSNCYCIWRSSTHRNTLRHAAHTHTRPTLSAWSARCTFDSVSPAAAARLIEGCMVAAHACARGACVVRGGWIVCSVARCACTHTHTHTYTHLLKHQRLKPGGEPREGRGRRAASLVEVAAAGHMPGLQRARQRLEAAQRAGAAWRLRAQPATQARRQGSERALSARLRTTCGTGAQLRPLPCAHLRPSCMPSAPCSCCSRQVLTVRWGPPPLVSCAPPPRLLSAVAVWCALASRPQASAAQAPSNQVLNPSVMWSPGRRVVTKQECDMSHDRSHGV